MRIAFAGASGTGKTTLASWVAQRYGIPLNPVGSRSVAKAMGFEHPYDADRAGKRGDFLQRLQIEKMEWEAKYTAFVTDRTTLDELAYTAMHDISMIDKAYWDAALKGWSRYTLVFYCPMDAFHDVANDPARVADVTYHRVFDAMIRGLIDKKGAVCTLHEPDKVKRQHLVEKSVRYRF